MAYIQVGGRADGAADAAPSPSALRASGAEAKRTPERTNKRKPDRKRGGREAAPLNRLAKRPLIPSRHALIFTVLHRAMLLSGVVLSLRG